MNLVGLLPVIGASAAALQIALTHLNAASAPQQAAGMAMACAYAIAPYVFARGIEMASVSNPKAERGIVLAAVIVALLVFILTAPIIPSFSDRREERLQRAKELDAIDRMDRERGQ